ncbi:MAG: precorrin-3B C(17)-methyltransferase [Synergistaceae bacterium]|jgi:precorrin-3B C17-methyltransferase|nr:precorrin-3B C(17)-methyltransferase [Synergistaceae bacterium]
MIFVVGIGPGGDLDMTPQAVQALERAEVIMGYKTYIDLLAPAFERKKTLSFAMKQEIERCRQAVELARTGQNVALVSGGDAGVYGMAGPVLEVLDALGDTSVEVEVIPGVTAACSAAAALGAPLNHDFAVVSLSDLLTPWSLIEKRLALAAEADFVLCLYNPASQTRKDYLGRACDAVMTFRDGVTPSGWVRNAGREGQACKILPLSELRSESLDMLCTVVIGNSETKILNGRMVTPRGYFRGT